MKKSDLNKYSFLGSVAMLVAALLVVSVHDNGRVVDAAGKDGIKKNKELLDRVGASVVKLRTPDHLGGGTGFSIGVGLDHSVVITNWHVCRYAVDGRMIAEITESDQVFVSVLRSDPKVDLCALSTIRSIPALSLAEQDPEKLSVVLSVGHPGLKQKTPSIGHIVGQSEARIPISEEDGGACPPGVGRLPFEGSFGLPITLCALHIMLVDTTITSAPGASGSPVVSLDGRVVGVINSTNGVASYGAMVPLASLKQFLGALQ